MVYSSSWIRSSSVVRVLLMSIFLASNAFSNAYLACRSVYVSRLQVLILVVRLYSSFQMHYLVPLLLPACFQVTSMLILSDYQYQHSQVSLLKVETSLKEKSCIISAKLKFRSNNTNKQRQSFILVSKRLIVSFMANRKRIDTQRFYDQAGNRTMLILSMFENGTNFQNKKGLFNPYNSRQYQQNELRDLEEGNRRIAAENSKILERVKNKWKTNIQLKKRLKYLQNLAKTINHEVEDDESKRALFRKHKSLQGFVPMSQTQDIQALQQKFNALVIQNIEQKGISRAKIRAEMSQLAKKIRAMKSLKISNKV